MTRDKRLILFRFGHVLKRLQLINEITECMEHDNDRAWYWVEMS